MRQNTPVDGMLLAYATGALGPEEALVISTLIALDARARQQVAQYEALGGRVLEEEKPAAVRCLDAVMKKLDGCGKSTPEAPRMPEPLAKLLRGCASDMNACWSKRKNGVERIEIRVCTTGPRPDLFLLRMAPNTAIPQHAHTGAEITLVLEGSYTDAYGRYRRGDIAVFTDPAMVHTPRAEAEGCLCLMLVQGPLRFANPLLRFFRGRA